jgi:hypothetical protein
VVTSLPDQFDLGYRRVMRPGCESCQPAEMGPPPPMLVDRYLQPIHRRHALLVRGDRLSPECFVEAHPEEPRVSIDWSDNGRRSRRSSSSHEVRRPAVKVGGRWLRRVPNVVVMG